jgi:hypothetical protein
MEKKSRARLLKVGLFTSILSVFLQTSSAYASEISTVSQLLAITGGQNYVLMNNLNLATGDANNATEGIQLADEVTEESLTYITNELTGTLDGAGFSISGLTKPLFNIVSGDVSNLNLVSGIGEFGVIGNGALANIQGLGTIDSVSFTGDVRGEFYLEGGVFPIGVGGLVGSSYGGTISNSYTAGTVEGDLMVGGLVGLQVNGTIINSYATGAVEGSENVGGLVGGSADGGTLSNSISNSYAAGDVTATGYFVGGLVGSFEEGTISNSYATGAVEGIHYIGGLVGGLSDKGIIRNSYATGDVTGEETSVDVVVGGLFGYSEGTVSGGSYATGDVNDEFYVGPPAPEILSVVNTGSEDAEPFAVNASINGGMPYLISLINSYNVVEEDTEETPSFNLRSFYTQAAKSLDKDLISFGFKSNFSSHSNLGFQALEQNQSNSPAVIQLFEVSEYQNSNILLSKEDGLQLSISSYYKESVEIWTQGLEGEYLYLGLVEFDKDGQAILPTLKFDTADTYQLLMIKAADKLSQKPNLEAKVGQVTINVI